MSRLFGNSGGGYDPYGGGGFSRPGGGMSWAEILTFGMPFGKIFGIRIRLHILLILFMAFNLFQYIGELHAFILFGLLMPIILFGTVLLHELGHCYGAWIVRGGAQQILLWPLGGVAMVHGAEKSPYAELLVTALGPAVNLVIMVPTWIALQFMPDPFVAGTNSMVYFYVYMLTRITYLINAVLFFFNVLVPIFPMDSARFLRGALSLKMPAAKATALTCKIGIWVAGFGLILALFGGDIAEKLPIRLGPIFVMICVLGIFTCLQEMAKAKLGFPIYSTYISGYGGSGFYSDTPADWRKVRLWQSVKNAASGFSSGIKNRAQKLKPGEARVVDIGAERAREEAAESPRLRYLRELRELEDDLKSAVKAEDFQRAGRLKKKIAEKKAQKI